MKTRAFAVAAVIVAAIGWMSEARSAEPNWPATLTIATASPGGTYYTYGEGLAKILTRVLRLPVAARPTEGPSENIRLIEEGDAQLGFVTMGVALQGWNGTGDWTGGKEFRPGTRQKTPGHGWQVTSGGGFISQTGLGLALAGFLLEVPYSGLQ